MATKTKSSDSISAQDSATARIQQYLVEEKLVPPCRLPSGRILAKRWKIDFSTLNRAIRELTSHGILRREGYKLFLQRLPEVPLCLSPAYVISPSADTFRGTEEISALHSTYTVAIEWQWYSYRAKVRSLLESKCEGLIVWCGNVKTPVDDLLAKLSGPVVTLENRFPFCSSVEMDCERAAALAVNHLVGLKHQEIACVSEKGLPWHEAFTEGYFRACTKMGLESSSKRIFSIEHTEPAARRTVASLRSEHPYVTGLLVNDVSLVDYFLDALKDKVAVPDDLSIVVYGDPDHAAMKEPPLTAVTNESYLMGKIAATILFGQKLRVAKTGLSQKPEHVRLEPQLIVRSSSRAPHSSKILPSHEDSTIPAESKNHPRWPSSLEERRALVEKIWETPHPQVELLSADRFFTLDIRPYANRALNRYNSWIGFVPLLMPKTGRQKIHGVVFDIISSKAIVMRSLHAHAANLEEEINIPVRRHADAIYFLHGCGWVVDHAKVGMYRFEYSDGTTIDLPVVAHGDDPSDPGFQRQWSQESNIQDWWPSFTQFNNHRARHLVIVKDGDPEVYERYLYTLEWVNPHPEKMITSITITSDPNSRATLGVLAISLLLPLE